MCIKHRYSYDANMRSQSKRIYYLCGTVYLDICFQLNCLNKTKSIYCLPIGQWKYNK